MTDPSPEQQAALKQEIALLEQKLKHAKAQLNDAVQEEEAVAPLLYHTSNELPHNTTSTLPTHSLHTLLLLSDSALPLGSFAFSSGLESFLAHEKVKVASSGNTANPSQLSSFHIFLKVSLQSLASAALPYVLAAYREPSRIEEWDNDFDASAICTVARRASVAQGRALLSVWERSFRDHHTLTSSSTSTDAISFLASFSTSLKSSSHNAYPPNAHLAPLWGILTLILSIPLHSSAYLFLFSHARTVISAAVRASVLGPYQAQHVLASTELRDLMKGLVERYWDRRTEDAGQTVPAVDLWVGRHELLYSRIFNS
ncbi:hypothetical protein EJ08DRAFT_599171 [Tothia fuscella]|uniref:Urease accessory protein UreF n=1 Tax=Tothia fuscella TaxID=1048955 RepID=A0A9P4NFD3_9PEZI|nr:hypothetical protein EJ08DRAFT_599171 [Tothia fuscella]